MIFFTSRWVLAEKIHVVEKGESIFKISRLYGVGEGELMRVNGLDDPTKLNLGQRLVIPEAEGETKTATAEQADEPPKPPEPEKTPEIYTVKKGDTLTAICQRFQVVAEVVRDLNGLKNNAVRVGQKLRLIPLTPEPQPKPEKRPPNLSEKRATSTFEPPRYLFINKVKALLDRPKIEKGRWRYIVLHHSGTPSGNAKMFDYYHRSRGMENGLAYHFVIGNGHDSGDGEIEVGGRWLHQLQGGHVKGDALNEISLGICFVGDFTATRPSKRQIAAAIELILYLRQRCGRPYPVMQGHREINPRHTECPGQLFPLEAMHKLFKQAE